MNGTSSLGLGLAFALVVLSAAANAAAEEIAAAETAVVRFVDAAPLGPSVAERLVEVRRRIQAALVYPPSARLQRVEGEALVRFEIDRSGAAQEVRVFRTSGKPSLDRAAVRAVTAAVPLPWIYGRLEVPVQFVLEDR